MNLQKYDNFSHDIVEELKVHVFLFLKYETCLECVNDKMTRKKTSSITI